MVKKKITTTVVTEEIIDVVEKDLSAYILLDRSGSMGSMWVEATGSVDGYVAEMVKNKKSGKVTIALFDGEAPFEIVADNVPFAEYTSTLSAYAPRGMTPLFDATGKMIAKAEIEKNEKTVLIVMTDGHENASKEYNKVSIKAAIDRVTKLGWEVIYLGANFDVTTDATAAGLYSNKFMNSTVANLGATMTSMASRSMAYAGTMSVDSHTGNAYAAGAAFDITDEDKKKSI